MSRAEAEELRERLLAWYRVHARDLPWRHAPAPYEVMLSELMLQQTRVDTVIPYYHRFLARWPTLQDLAAADEDDVLEMWAGLGYYRRARNLLKAARQAASQGGLPATPEGLRELPGIGAYTAGAIASIAFGVPTHAVDGNVERVLSRVDAREDDPKKAKGRRALAARAEALSAPGVAAEVTQGLMELGATVCTPRSPDCPSCPWFEPCLARAQDRVEELPRKAKRRKPTPVSGAAGLLWRDGSVVVGKRPPGLLGGLWEPVSTRLAEGEPAEEGVRRAFAERAGLEVSVSAHLGTVTHVFTHRRLTLQVFEVSAPAAAPLRGDGSYVDLGLMPPGAEGWALSRLARKVLATARAAQPPLPLAAERGPS